MTITSQALTPPPLPEHFMGGMCELPHLGVLQAEGPDAVSFLHNQLTHDFALLPSGQARLCGYCSPKGRMLASFTGFKQGPEKVLLVCARDVLPATLKRLSMFVLRAKVRLSDVSAELPVYGIAGPALAAWVGDRSLTPWHHHSMNDGDLLTQYPALGQPRALWLGSGQSVGLPALALDDWMGLEILSGIAQVQSTTVDAFVPQMLNYESVDGVSFKKGCYPGQEVVARSQFRGAIKRRAQVFQSEVPLPVGTELFSSQDPTQPAGLVAQSALWAGHPVLIASVQRSALDSTDTHLQDAQGHRLALLPLPYPLRDDL
jgi:folate-binding protein YgfZ